MNFKICAVAAVLISCITCPCAHAENVTGVTDFGTAGVRAITVEKEKEMGELFVTVAKSQLPVIYDPVLEQYVTSLLSRMSSKAVGVRYPFEPIIVEDHTINAAAFFGGKIMLSAVFMPNIHIIGPQKIQRLQLYNRQVLMSKTGILNME